MKDKMESPSKPYKSIDIEVEEIVEEIMDEGSIPSAQINVPHCFVEHPRSDDDLLDPIAAIDAPRYSSFFQVPQKTTKKRKITVEPIVDYIQSHVLISD